MRRDGTRRVDGTGHWEGMRRTEVTERTGRDETGAIGKTKGNETDEVGLT